MPESKKKTESTDIRERLRHSLHHFEHVLPGQAPIKDFVHHNTLHGFQHLSFTEALAEAERITGAHGYLPQERFREFYQAGRITLEDLQQIIEETPELDAGKVIFEDLATTICRRDVLIAGLLHPLKKLTGCQLNWQIEEMHALQKFQPDIDPAARQKLLDAAARQGLKSEAEAIADLWAGSLETLGLEFNMLHPEERADGSIPGAG